MKRLLSVHPGEILVEQFLVPNSVSANRLAGEIGMTNNELSRIISGRSGITSDIAIKLSGYFGNSARFWIALQTNYDLEEAIK